MNQPNQTHMSDTLHQVSRDALGLSSGTIAGLIDNSLYAVIDAVQYKFFEYCQAHDGEFDTWVKAWHAFIEDEDVLESLEHDYGNQINLHPGSDRPEFPTVAGEGAPQYCFVVDPGTQLALKL
jgi:hypothetical protein